MIPYTRVIEQPEAEPLTLDELKLHLRITVADEDSWLTSRITAARQAAESFCNRFIAEQTVEMRTPGWPGRCSWIGTLPGSDPATSVVVKYLDADNAEQTLDPGAYALGWGAPTWIFGEPRTPWPALAAGPDTVRVQYVAGYGEGNPTPEDIKHAMLLMIGEWYEGRENAVIGSSVAEIPNGVKTLLWPYRMALGV